MLSIPTGERWRGVKQSANENAKIIPVAPGVVRKKTPPSPWRGHHRPLSAAPTTEPLSIITDNHARFNEKCHQT